MTLDMFVFVIANQLENDLREITRRTNQHCIDISEVKYNASQKLHAVKMVFTYNIKCKLKSL